ncbi:hypothetical protein MON38_09750 [Hymenobacter sp. DH14]|uniref:Uncharacterized protein n=1 Tax=Hymenobacter cyanobacteriorum TaxID=2926463 RepID=A0A9X2AHM5_9BACT|nr:hypothetical protein [Hymenobacter cyanobacteriorum]MCI1187705.1 hypothetical protein [Hymenobacter cyanobacteriorum]
MYRQPFLLGLGALLIGAGLPACTPDAEHADKPKARASVQALQGIMPHFDEQWAMNKLWEDGLAEVATYDAERTVYKKKRQFEYTLITVKEEFNQQFNVKTDDYKRDDLFPVMKVNEFCQIPADQYPYHYLTSLFFRRDQPVALYKMTSSSQEWCGNTFKAIVDDGVNFKESYNSYWDLQGVGSRDLRRDVLLEDALPYTLRTLRFAQQSAFDLVVMDLQQTSKAGPPAYYNAHLSTTEAPAAEAPAPAWRVAVQLAPDKQNVYWFAKAYPNMLLRQTTWDGRTLRLKSQRRYAYWPK